VALLCWLATGAHHVPSLLRAEVRLDPWKRTDASKARKCVSRYILIECDPIDGRDSAEAADIDGSLVVVLDPASARQRARVNSRLAAKRELGVLFRPDANV